MPRPTYGLWINSSRPLLDNRDVRIGIHHATNWELVIEKFFRGDAVRMQTTSDGYGDFTHPTLRARTFSVERALESFARAGFTERGPDGVLVNGQGQRLSFTLTTGYEALRDILTILREEARKAGLEFRLEVLDATASWKKVQEKQHDIQFSAFAVSAEMYPRYWETYHSANAYKNAFLSDGTPNPAREVHTQTNNLEMIALPELDRLIEAYDQSSDVQEMKRLAFQMEEILHDYASFVPGFINPFFRVGTWRWVGNPPGFNVKISRSWDEYYLYWIDEEMKRETLEARRSRTTFEPQVRVYDQFLSR
jgi:microcin C transport system substrate-binding protein